MNRYNDTLGVKGEIANTILNLDNMGANLVSNLNQVYGSSYTDAGAEVSYQDIVNDLKRKLVMKYFAIDGETLTVKHYGIWKDLRDLDFNSEPDGSNLCCQS